MCVSVIKKFLTYLLSTVNSVFFIGFGTFSDCQPCRGSVFMIRLKLVNVTQMICLSVLMLVCVNIHTRVKQLPQSNSSNRTDCWLP